MTAPEEDGPGLRWWIEGVAPWVLGLITGLAWAERRPVLILIAALITPGLIRYGRRVARDVDVWRAQRSKP